jgi:hypothetical protein
VSKEIEIHPVQLPALCTVEQDREDLRQIYRPWVAMSCITLAAAAERLIASATGEEQIVLIVTMIVAFAAAVIIGHLSRTRLMGKQLRRRFMASVWLGAGWLVYVGACGLSWGAIATLVVAGVALSALFWR